MNLVSNILPPIKEFDFALAHPLTKTGIKHATLRSAKDALAIDSNLSVPAYLYRCLEGTLTGISSMGFTYKNHSSVDGPPGFFYFQEVDFPLKYTKINLFPSPLELLSYYQLKDNNTKAFNVALEPGHKIDYAKELRIHFPYAKFYSYIPNTTGKNIIINLRLSLILSGKKHSLTQSSNQLKLTIGSKSKTFRLDEISEEIIPCISQKTARPLYFKRPPRPFASFNEILRHE